MVDAPGRSPAARPTTSAINAPTGQVGDQCPRVWSSTLHDTCATIVPENVGNRRATHSRTLASSGQPMTCWPPVQTGSSVGPAVGAPLAAALRPWHQPAPGLGLWIIIVAKTNRAEEHYSGEADREARKGGYSSWPAPGLSSYEGHRELGGEVVDYSSRQGQVHLYVVTGFPRLDRRTIPPLSIDHHHKSLASTQLPVITL